MPRLTYSQVQSSPSMTVPVLVRELNLRLAEIKEAHNLAEPSAVTVASAASIDVPVGPIVTISGTTKIDTIASKTEGSIIRLLFGAAADLEDASTASGNIKLSGAADWTTIAANDTITLVCDGTDWIELSRSVNS